MESRLVRLEPRVWLRTWGGRKKMIGEVYCPKAGTTEGLWEAHAGGIEEDGQEESEMV